MIKLDDIKASIGGLSETDQTALKRWLDAVDAKNFDQKIERDASSGKLDDLVANARANYRAGRRTPLSQKP
jgi:hypothetical protein